MRMWRAQGLNIPLSMDGPHPITTKRGACVLEPVRDVGAHMSSRGVVQAKRRLYSTVSSTPLSLTTSRPTVQARSGILCASCASSTLGPRWVLFESAWAPVVAVVTLPCRSQYKTQLSQQYKLPQSHYKGGKVRSQYIRKRQAPVIEEVEETTPSTRSKPKAAAATKPKTQKVIRVKAPDEHAKHSILCRDTAGGELYAWANEDESPGANDGRSPVEIVVRILLDKMPADALPDVDVAEEVVVLKATGHHPLGTSPGSL